MERLEQSKKFYNELWEEYLRLGDILTGPDTFVMTILNRANALNEAFCELTAREEDNRIAIVPLLRVQMDNLLYCYAGTICEDFSVFMRCFVFGDKWTTLTDRDGNQLTEGYLVNKLSDAFQNEALKEIYKLCSEFVHLTNHHLYITLSRSEDGMLHQTVGNYNDVADKSYVSIIMETLNLYLIRIIRDNYFPTRREEMRVIKLLREQFPEKSDLELMNKYAFNHDNAYIHRFFSHLKTRE